MRARIHGASAEIGGSCVELEARGGRIVLDIGLPLSQSVGETPLPEIAGPRGSGCPLLGVVVSHAHPDHYGLITKIPDDVSVFAGAATARILREAAFFTSAGADPLIANSLEHKRSLRIGPFTLTPFLVDHSAFDAYALLVEADGRRLFYTGDIRFHGRKAASTECLLRSPPPAHVLLMEGTQVGRPQSTASQSEREVEERALSLMRETEGIVLCFFSPQNVDRLVTLFRAAKRAGRTFVYDLYGASVAAATGRRTIPQPDWPEVRVYVPHSQRRRVIASGDFERINSIRRARIFARELAKRRSDIVMLFRPSMGREVERVGALEGARVIWSQWPGYLDEARGRQARGWLRARRIPLEVIHASGHASVQDLNRMASAFGGARLVPIHTRHPERYAETFGRAEIHSDGEWWNV
jgi:ribonuclease J